MFSADPGESWGEYRVYGSSQTDKYEPLYTRVAPDGTYTRWKLTDADRANVAAGGDLILRILNGGGPIQPVAVWIE